MRAMGGLFLMAKSNYFIYPFKPNLPLPYQTDKVRSVADRSRARGSSLVKVISAKRQVDRARLALESAQEELKRAEDEFQAAMDQAVQLMAEEEQSRAVVGSGPGSAGTAAMVGIVAKPIADSAQNGSSPGPPPAKSDLKPAVQVQVESSGGGWGEVTNLPANQGGGGRSGGWKFKINLPSSKESMTE
jgi:hypothetical protein